MQKRKSPIEGVRARGVRVAVPQADVVPSQRAMPGTSVVWIDRIPTH